MATPSNSGAPWMRWLWRQLEGVLPVPASVPRQLRTFTNLGKPTEAPIPWENLPMGADLLAQGVSNFGVFQTARDWVWPFWVERQFDPRSDSFVPRGFNLIAINGTHRNWTAVGPAWQRGNAIVDPRGMVTPLHRGYSVDVWLQVDGQTPFYPSRAPGAEQWVAESHPQVTTTFSVAPDVELTLHVWADAVNGMDTGVESACLRNGGDAALSGRLFVAIRPCDPEGIAPIFRITSDFPGFFTIEGNLGPIFETYPEEFLFSNHAAGDIANRLDTASAPDGIECAAGLCTAVAVFPFSLDPGAEMVRRWCFPLEKVPAELGQVYRVKDHRPTSEGAREAFLSGTKTAVAVTLPEPWNGWLKRASNALCLRQYDDIVTPGPYTYDQFWFRDAAYLLWALDRLGHHERVRRVLTTYPLRQTAAGFFRSQDGEWDSNGQAMWSLLQHVDLTGDNAFLEEVYPALLRGATWIDDMRRVDPNARGLLPPGLSAEHLGHNDYYYWDDFWAVAGLRDAERAAGRLGREADRQRLRSIRKGLEEAIADSLTDVTERLGEALYPAGPNRGFDCGAIGAVCGWYPTGVLEDGDPALARTVDRIVDELFVDGLFFQEMVHSGLNVYLTIQVAQCFLRRGYRQGHAIFRTVMERATPTQTFPEAINPRTGGGVMGDGHHAWADAEVVLFILESLLRWDRAVLVLFPAPVDEWFETGARVAWSELPTPFGPVSVDALTSRGSTEISITAQFRHAPESIRLGIPSHVQEVIADGTTYAPETFGDFRRVELPPLTRHILLRS